MSISTSFNRSGIAVHLPSAHTPRSSGAAAIVSMASRWCRRLVAALVAAVLLAGTAPLALSAATVDTVITPGLGTLTKCRSWVVYSRCATYHKIAVPEQIAVGDEISLTYGSNTKTYIFHVVRIRREGNSCAIWGERNGPDGEGEKLEIGQCRSAQQPASKAR
jgi:hypothetical protein